MILKLSRVNDKERILKAAKVKRWQSAKLMVDKLSYQPHKLSLGFLAETLQAKRLEWHTQNIER